MYFARKNSCVKISREEVAHVHELETNHEEADTKMCYLLHHAQRQNNGAVVRSSSGDIDFPIILLENEIDNLRVFIFINNGTGKARKLFDLTLCDLSQRGNGHFWDCTPFLAMIISRPFFEKERKLVGRW